MKILEKAKQFCKEHKTAVVSTLVGVGTFVTGWVVRKKIDCAVIDKCMDMLPGEIDKELKKQDGENASLSLVTDESLKRFEEEQEELRGKYGNDFAILEEATKNLTEPEKGKLWLIENGVVSLVDGIEYNEEAEES
jgi:hypothetical protein